MKKKLKIEGTQSASLMKTEGDKETTEPALIVSFTAVLTRDEFNSLKSDKDWCVDAEIKNK